MRFPGHSISQFLTNRQADSKMRLVFAQAVNNEFSIGNILTTFKNSIKIFVTFDAVAFSNLNSPIKFILLYHIFKKTNLTQEIGCYLNTDKSKGKVW